MITIQEAAKAADEFIRKVYGEIEETQLEEIETNDEKTFWFITLSFVIKDATKANISGPLIGLINPYQRKFKTLIINAQTGEVTKMKMWPLEVAK
jgi:hypothetical protein